MGRASPTRWIAAFALCAGALAVGVAGWRGAAAETPPSVYASAEIERVVRDACAARAPFVVLDTFAMLRPGDVDHFSPAPDAEAPLRPGHGDVVAAIASVHHDEVIAYQIDPRFTARTLAADFRRLADDVEGGRIAKPAAVVSSIVLPVDLGDVNRLMEEGDPIAPGDLARRRGEALRLVAAGDDRNPYAAIDRQLARLRRAGVPVFVAAGNTGPDTQFNVLALSDGVFAVGALDRDGAPAPYVSLPEFVSIWSPGRVVIGETADGLSVSGGRGVELKGAALPEQRATLAAFVGQPAERLVREIPREAGYLPAAASSPSSLRQRYVRRLLTPGLYRTEELMRAYGYPAGSGNFIRSVAEGPFMHYPSDTIFTVDVDGRLAFDPRGDRSEGQLRLEDATSFAAPNICANPGRDARRAAL
ncbi:hypothetical protein [Hansschlegelia sp. KR7-227]|uniref:hypothetical protein n=1 Tax=Hansschlegelia sp. KR7-227 TaxID=3400914 RepID=UPI003BFE7F60